MAFKTLLTISTDAKQAAVVFDVAAGIARDQDGHLEALALGLDRTQLGYSYVGAEALMLPVAQEAAQSDAKEVEAAIRAAAARQADGLRWSVESLYAMMGSVPDLISLRARFADLVILPRSKDEGLSAEEEMIAEAAMFEGQAPVLISFPEVHKSFGEHVVIAWNQSREALDATRRALPFLKRAKRVTITIVDPPTYGAERSDPGGALCQMLVRHGVQVEIAVIASGGDSFAKVITRHMREIGADLLVMGAYSHSRLREAIMGGATRDLLRNAQTAVFMAH